MVPYLTDRVWPFLFFENFRSQENLPLDAVRPESFCSSHVPELPHMSHGVLRVPLA